MASENEVKLDESMVGKDKSVCDGVINTISFVVWYEGLVGKDVIKDRFDLTGVTILCMVRALR